ncbi:MAG: hypothetical protein QGH54_16890, partial [SAR202 cluster bacterium]|nr:hypothetical protein [SAR202 cluster bacterium]
MASKTKPPDSDSIHKIWTFLVVTAAVLLALVPAATAVTYTGNGTYSYPPIVGDEGIDAGDTTTINILSGTIEGDVESYDNSTVNFSGGTIEGYIESYGDSTVTITGGSIEEYLDAYAQSTVIMTGGSVESDMFSDGDATITVSGGTLGDDLGIEAIDDSTITFIGSFGFAYGDYVDGGLLDDDTLLTGTLADGTAISNIVNIEDSATITLAAPAGGGGGGGGVVVVPEPAT